MATFDQERVDQVNEYVSIMEGIALPFFGIAYSLEKIQYNSDMSIDSKIDHSLLSLELAQKFANLFVDEGRLNDQFFASR